MSIETIKNLGLPEERVEFNAALFTVDAGRKSVNARLDQDPQLSSFEYAPNARHPLVHYMVQFDANGQLAVFKNFINRQNQVLVPFSVESLGYYIDPAEFVTIFSSHELAEFVDALIPSYRREIDANNSSGHDLVSLHKNYLKEILNMVGATDPAKRDRSGVEYSISGEKIEEIRGLIFAQWVAAPVTGTPSAPVTLPATPPATSTPGEQTGETKVSSSAPLSPIVGKSYTGSDYMTIVLPPGTVIGQISGYGRTDWRHQRTGDRVMISLPQTLPSSSAGNPVDFDITFADGSRVHASAVVEERSQMSQEEEDREVVAGAGIFAPGGDDELAGSLENKNLSEDLMSGIGGLIGSKGTQMGSGGLGARGDGSGGGGTAEGLGGLATKGRGSGASGYGSSSAASPGKEIAAIGGNPTILGALDEELLKPVIKRHITQIRSCYYKELAKNPSLAGNITIRFVIAKDGSVSSASVKSSTMGNRAVEDCICGRIMRFQFPEPKGGGIVIASYLFIFSPG